MKAWFQRFMSGRYGSDTFGNFLCVTALVCLVIGLFVGIFYYIGLLLLLYAYFRMLSRNVHKRYAENIAFMQKTAGVRAKFGQLQQRFALRKTYRYFSCPHCRQQVRVPKGRGKISITCPKCGTQFIKKAKAIPHNSKCRYGERGAADAKPKAQIILDVLSSILATQMPCRSRRSGA